MSKTLYEVIHDIDKKFSSANSIPVTRAALTSEEWEIIREGLEEAFPSDTLSPKVMAWKYPAWYTNIMATKKTRLDEDA